MIRICVLYDIGMNRQMAIFCHYLAEKCENLAENGGFLNLMLRKERESVEN